MSYKLLDSGGGAKWEEFGGYRLERPCPQAVWHSKLEWKSDGVFTRGEGWRGKLPKEWEIELEGVKLLVRPTEFGHLGVFPEHARLWKNLEVGRGMKVLNLFAYSGGASIAAALKGAEVTHVDSAKGMVDWAAENARLNGVGTIRWVVEDAVKFLKREVKRGNRYDGVILDPPTFGRGAKGEVFKIEEELMGLVEMAYALAKEFVLLSCHTPGFTPIVLKQVMEQGWRQEVGEMMLEAERGFSIPSGSYAWAKR
jgi:23S rRNA (cytosine1962-C5)-methyltransferase